MSRQIKLNGSSAKEEKQRSASQLKSNSLKRENRQKLQPAKAAEPIVDCRCTRKEREGHCRRTFASNVIFHEGQKKTAVYICVNGNLTGTNTWMGGARGGGCMRAPYCKMRKCMHAYCGDSVFW